MKRKISLNGSYSKYYFEPFPFILKEKKKNRDNTHRLKAHSIGSGLGTPVPAQARGLPGGGKPSWARGRDDGLKWVGPLAYQRGALLMA
jgi:hypothetical protein